MNSERVWDARAAMDLAWQRYQQFRRELFRIEIASRIVPGVLVGAGALLAARFGLLSASDWWAIGIGVALYGLLNGVLAGHYLALLAAARGEQPRLGHLLEAWRAMPKMAVLFVLTYIAVVVGFLAIVPGIWISQRLRFAPHAAMDQGVGPIAAMKQSFAMTRGQSWRLFKQDVWDETLAQANASLATPMGKLDIALATAIAEAIVYLDLSDRAPPSVKRALEPHIEPARVAAQPASMGPPCPRCADAMQVVSVPDLQLHRCLACGGVWLDCEGSRAVTEELAHNAVAAADAAAQIGRLPVDRAAPARCPVCQEVLARVNPVGGIEIDVCEQHGTWFDREELRLVSHALHPIVESAQGSVYARGAKNIAVSFARNVVAILTDPDR